MDERRLKSTGNGCSIGRKIDLAAARVMASTAPRDARDDRMRGYLQDRPDAPSAFQKSHWPWQLVPGPMMTNDPPEGRGEGRY